jgi:phage shock protein C
MDKKLTKSSTDRKICGVCGGIAEYLNMDPTIVRLLFVLLAFTSVGIVAYLAMAIVMPD